MSKSSLRLTRLAVALNPMRGRSRARAIDEVRGQVGHQADGDPFLANARGLREVRPYPQPPVFDGKGLERVQEDGLPHAAQAGQDQVLQDYILIQQAQKLFLLLPPPGQVRRHVPAPGRNGFVKPPLVAIVSLH